MKKLLLIIGILCFVVCVLCLCMAALSAIGYFHVMDGSSDLYNRLRMRMILFAVSGIVLAVSGILCMIVRAKK